MSWRIQVVPASLNGLTVEIKANLYENAVFLLSLHVDSSLESGACAPCPRRGGALGSAPSAASPRGRRGEEGGLHPLCVAVRFRLSSVKYSRGPAPSLQKTCLLAVVFYAHFTW